MAIPCPKCTVSAAIGIEGEFVFFGGQCIELLGTRYVNRFEWCPILSEAIAQEVRKQEVRNPLHNLTLDGGLVGLFQICERGGPGNLMPPPATPDAKSRFRKWP